MDKEFFERLLYEEESTTLDFKSDQYKFRKATDDEKSELLKDILGFCNAWRRSEAYILIGVKEVRGGRSKVIGIPPESHLDDHALQQFVNNLTNQPVHFHYEAFGFDGKQVGILTIEEQVRPVYLKRNYGKLLKEKVYVRRGSSTNPSDPASLEEIAQMRVQSGPPTSKLDIEFADVEVDIGRGRHISANVELLKYPPLESLPDYIEHNKSNPLGLGIPNVYDLNRDFFREFANYEFFNRLFCQVKLVVKNTGRVVATGVRIEITSQVTTGLLVLDELPRIPIRRGFSLNIGDIGPEFHRQPGDVFISKNSNRYFIEIDCGDLQPGRSVRSEPFYIGKEKSGDFPLHGSIFADNLPVPIDFTLVFSPVVIEKKMSSSELCSFAEQAVPKE